ncbi:MAG TPA: ABC transporter substrate-binding protein [Alphaproteobacteria bacterium]|nr:ABC transporter substrate-binding protein [Alphaproteobacteria bacterium]
MFKISRRDIGALLIGAGLAALAGVTGVQGATPGDTLVMAKAIDDIISLDPAEVYEFSGGEIINNVYDRIMTFDPKDFTKLVGGAAESYAVSDDGLTLTLKMRKGIKFPSGRESTAGDAAFSLQRVVILDKTPAFILTQFGWTKDNVKEMVTAPDDSTLVLKITKPFAPTFVLNCLTSGVGSVVDQEEAMKHAQGDDLGYNWLKTNSAGSGAYKVVSWNAKDSVVLEANPNFHAGPAKLKRVVIRHVGEATAQRLLLEKGDADIARNLTADQIKAIAGNKELVVQTEPKTNIYYFAVNVKDPTLANPKVQQALRWLIDYQGMEKTFLEGQFKVHQAFWGSGSAGALDDTPFHLDVAKAKALLAEAGVANGFTIDIDVANAPPFPDVAQSVQSTFGQAGIKVNLVQADQRQVITKYRARKHQGVLLYWSPDYLDPHSTADYFARNPDNSDDAKTKTIAWRNSWDIPELTKETDAALLEKDSTKRMGDYVTLQRKLQQAGPIMIMFQQNEQAVARSNVKGFILGPSFDTVVYWQTTK